MVREVRVFDSVNTRPVFGVGYSVIVFEPGAEVAVASSGTSVEVQKGHSLANSDWVIADLDTTTYRRVVSVTVGTTTDIVEVSANLPVAAGQMLVNLGADTGSTGPDFLGSGATIYSDSGYTTVSVNSGVRTDINGFARYWHKGIPRWELVLGELQEPLFLFIDTNLNEDDQVSYGIRYAHLFAESGTGTADDPWPGACVLAAWNDLPAGTSGMVKCLSGVFDLGDDQIGLNLDTNGVYTTGFVLEGSGGGNEQAQGVNEQYVNDGGTIFQYSGTGEAIRIGDFSTSGSTWIENARVRNLTIRQTGTVGTGMGLLARLYRWGRFENITFSDFAVGMGLASVSDFNVMDGIRIRNCRTYGVDVGRSTDANGLTLGGTNGQCNGNRFVNCDIMISERDSAYTAWGIYVHQNCVQIAVRDSEFHNFDTSGYGAIIVSDATTDSSIVSVQACYIEGCYAGVYFNNPLATGNYHSGITVKDCYIAQIEGYGVWVNSGSTGETRGVVITGNVFDVPNSSSPYNAAIGIQLGTYIDTANIFGNVFSIGTVVGTLPGQNIKHGSLGTLAHNNLTMGTQRITGATLLDSTLAVTGASMLTAGIVGGTPYNLGIWAPPSATPGTYKQPVTTEMYVGSVRVPMNATITGIKYLIGTAVPGAQKVIAALYNSAGTRVAISVAGGTTMTNSASVTQSLAFTGSTYAAVGPGTYFIGLMFDTATANLFATVPLGVDAGSSIVGVVTTGLTALTPPSSITAPSTFPATSVVPVASLY